MPKPADIDEARRRLAAHPPEGDPGAVPGETLDEKAARLRADGLDDEHVRIEQQPDGTALIRLPYVDYLDTQAGPVEVGLDDTLLRELHAALGQHLGADARTEFGTRFEHGEIMLRPSRELALRTVTAILGRGGQGALMTRQVITTGWTEADPTT